MNNALHCEPKKKKKGKEKKKEVYLQSTRKQSRGIMKL